jgi:hypothetical protein
VVHCHHSSSSSSLSHPLLPWLVPKGQIFGKELHASSLCSPALEPTESPSFSSFKLHMDLLVESPQANEAERRRTDTTESESKEAGALLSAAGEGMRESGLDKAKRGSGLSGHVVESEFAETVASEDQQAAFLWERQRMGPSRNQGAHSFQ